MPEKNCCAYNSERQLLVFVCWKQNILSHTYVLCIQFAFIMSACKMHTYVSIFLLYLHFKSKVSLPMHFHFVGQGKFVNTSEEKTIVRIYFVCTNILWRIIVFYYILEKTFVWKIYKNRCFLTRWEQVNTYALHYVIRPCKQIFIS